VNGTRRFAIYAAAAAQFAAVAARMFLLPLQARAVGLSAGEIGLVVAAATLAAAALSLPAGALADRLGSRTVLAGATAAGVLSQLATSWVSQLDLLLPLQLVGGACTSAVMATLMAELTRVTPTSGLGRGLGWLTFSNQAGYLAGPAAAGVALTWLSTRQDLAVSALLWLLVLPAAVLCGPGRPGPGGRLRLAEALAVLARQPALVPLTLSMIAAALLWGTLEGYLPLVGRESMGLSGAAIGFLIAAQALVNGASRLPAGRLVDGGRHRTRLALLCILAYAAAVAAVPRLPAAAAAALVVLSVALIATAFVALATSFARLAPPELRSTTMALYVALLFVGLAAGPAVFGLWIDASGFAGGFGACAAVASALALGAAALRPGRALLPGPAAAGPSRRPAPADAEGRAAHKEIEVE